MNSSKPKYKLSIATVIIIFLLIYLGELGLGAGAFFGFILPKINSFQKARLALSISQNIINKQTAIYDLLEKNKLDEASKSAQLMLNQSKTPRDQALSLQVIGEVFAAYENYPVAKKYFQNALNLDDKLSGAYIGLATANLFEKDFQKSIVNAQKAIDLSPKRTDYYDILGLAYFGAGDKDKALKSIEKAIQGNPNIEQYKKDLDFVKNSTSQSSSPKNTQTTPSKATVPTSNLNYTQDDINSWRSELNYVNQDLTNLPKYNTLPNYNQLNDLLNKRMVIIERILNKMNAGQQLNNQDDNDISLYDNITKQYAQLAQSTFKK